MKADDSRHDVFAVPIDGLIDGNWHLPSPEMSPYALRARDARLDCLDDRGRARDVAVIFFPFRFVSRPSRR